ncbi:vacuolar membrane-associated protein iml1 [Geranomyces michiganensis]|nr:vacuolar membrane-associated protein iml1 [Geranomyces michiganensis]
MLPSYLRSSQYTTPNKANPALRPSYNLWVHDERFSPQDLVINPECFPACREGDLLKLTQPQSTPGAATSSLTSVPSENAGIDGGQKETRAKQSPQQTPKLSQVGKDPQSASERSRTLVLQVTSLDREINSKQPQLQISIAQHIAALFELHPRKDVLIDKETIAADYVELMFRDQYVGRSDMWRMRTLLTGACVYEGKKVISLGIRAQIKDIVVAGKRASCGYITENTKMIFRSETAKYFIFIQMSREMWEFDEDGELYFEKCVHGFLPQLFAKWKAAGANHVVSIVLFSRIYYQTAESDAQEAGIRPLFTETNSFGGEHSVPVLMDSAGRPYRDFYKVVVDWETRSDWGQVLVPLKREFISFQRDVLQQPSADGSTVLAGANSPASEGNLLEAINLALNPFDRHYIDRDLSRTGLSIVVITPGPGVYEADKQLLRLTAQRMVDNGIGLDLVCLSKPPLCTVPLFQYTSKDWAGPTPGWGGTPSGASTEADTATSGERRWAVPVAAAGAAAKTADRNSERAVTLGPPAIVGVGGTSGNSAASAQSSERLENWDPLYYDDSTTDNPEKTFYTVPHWVMCSFWTRDDENDRLGFTLRCKMYEVQMMGVMEQIGSTIMIRYLDQQEASRDVDLPRSSPHKKREAHHSGERPIPGVVRFEIGADDDEDSPAGSVISNSHIDCERYDEQVFVSTSRQRSGAGNVKTRSNSAVNMGSIEADGSSHVKNNGRATPRVDSHPLITASGGGPKGMIGGGIVSVSPEGATAANVSGTHINRMGYYRASAVDTVRSTDSDGQSNRGAYYHPWEDSGDTLTAEERVALLRVRARIEQARTGGSNTAWSQIKNVTSTTSISTMLAGAQRGNSNESQGLVKDDVPATERWNQRTGWPSQQQQIAIRSAGSGGMGSRKGSMLLNETGTMHAPRGVQVPGMHVSAAFDSSEAGAEGPRKFNIYSNEADDSHVASASTSLAPIKIRSSTSHLGVRSAYRDGLSTSGSFKGGHSPLANYEYLRQQYSKLSPGKPGTGGPSGGLRPASQSTFRANLINPCNPSRNIVRATSQLLRWQHVFPQVIVPTRNDIVIHWKSLSTPACLPLTTDFFPSHEDLSAFYQEYTYTVSPADDATPYQWRGDKSAEALNGRLKVEALLIELIGQRLSQGFQLIGSGLGGAVSLGDRGENALQSVVGNMSPQLGNRSGEAAKRGMSSTNGDGHPQTSQHSLPILQRHSSHEMMAQSVASTPFYLSLGDHVHKLLYDASGQNVEVKRYVRKVTYSTLPIHYACGIWRKNDKFYRPKQLAFAYPPVTLYNWNYLDHLISGYQEELTENLRFWRTRFLLIPLENVSHTNPFLNPQNENLDEEEARVVGFEKFIEVFERARWKLPWEEDEAELSSGSVPQGPSGGRKKKKGKFGKKLQIQLTTLNTSRFIRDEVLRRGLVGAHIVGSSTPAHSNALQSLTRRGSATSAPNLQTAASANNVVPAVQLTRASSFTAIAQAMQAPPPVGIGFGDRRWHFRLYESVFIGSECVEWMVRNFPDIDSREEAVVFGNVLLNEGLFEHATRKHKFLDGHYFYRIRGEYKVSPPGGKDRDREKGVPLWFGNRVKTSGSIADLPSGGDGGSGHSTHTSNSQPSADGGQWSKPPSAVHSASSSTATPPPVPTRTDPFPLTRRMVIDLDSQRRSPRRETALLHYDTVHNPQHCYHFQLHWLVCSPRWIEDLVGGWTRVAEKCGFKMVEAGTTQADSLSDDNPFLSMTHIVPCVTPPRENDAPFPATLYLEMIVRHFNFVLDVESDAAFPPNSVTWSYDRGSGYKRTQFVHRSGVAFVQLATVSEGGGFWWVANRMHLTGAGSTSAQTTSKDHRGGSGNGSNNVNAGAGGEKSTDPDTLMRAFLDFCNNEVELTAFYRKARETITGIYGAAKADAGAVTSSLNKTDKESASAVRSEPDKESDHNADAATATDTAPAVTSSEEPVSEAFEGTAIDLPAAHLIDADLPTFRVGEGGLPTGIDRLPVAAFATEDILAIADGQDPRPPWGRSRSIMDPAFFKPPVRSKSTAGSAGEGNVVSGVPATPNEP